MPPMPSLLAVKPPPRLRSPRRGGGGRPQLLRSRDAASPGGEGGRRGCTPYSPSFAAPWWSCSFCRWLLRLTNSRMAGGKPRERGYRPAGSGKREVTLSGRTPHSRILFSLRRLIYKDGAWALPPHCVSVAERRDSVSVCGRSNFPRGADRSSLPSPGRHGSLRAAGPAAASASAAGAAAAAAASAHPRHLQPWREYCV